MRLTTQSYQLDGKSKEHRKRTVSFTTIGTVKNDCTTGRTSKKRKQKTQEGFHYI
jgi:hypothetical protein